MEARLESSKKWSEMPTDVCRVIKQSLTDELGTQQEYGELIIEGKLFPNEVVLRLGFLPHNQIKQDNFEVSINFDPKSQKSIERIQTATETVFPTLTAYFKALENQKHLDFTDSLPIQWESCEVENDEVYMCYSSANSQLELEADKLLGEYDKKLINQDEEIEVEDLKSKYNLH